VLIYRQRQDIAKVDASATRTPLQERFHLNAGTITCVGCDTLTELLCPSNREGSTIE